LSRKTTTFRGRKGCARFHKAERRAAEIEETPPIDNFTTTKGGINVRIPSPTR